MSNEVLVIQFKIKMFQKGLCMVSLLLLNSQCLNLCNIKIVLLTIKW